MPTVLTGTRAFVGGPYRCVSCGTIVDIHQGDDFPLCHVEQMAVEWESVAGKMEDAEKRKKEQELREGEQLEQDKANATSWGNNP